MCRGRGCGHEGMFSSFVSIVDGARVCSPSFFWLFATILGSRVGRQIMTLVGGTYHTSDGGARAVRYFKGPRGTYIFGTYMGRYYGQD